MSIELVMESLMTLLVWLLEEPLKELLVKITSTLKFFQTLCPESRFESPISISKLNNYSDFGRKSENYLKVKVFSDSRPKSAQKLILKVFSELKQSKSD